METQTLAQIFNNAFFRVPDYQRGYAWEESQLEDFWKDLNWLRDEQQHYTGMLTLFRLIPVPDAFPSNAPHTVNHLVDGQQRLTTSILLLSKLIGRAANEMIGGQPVSIVKYNYLFATINGRQFPIFGYDSPSKMNFLSALLEQRSVATTKPKKIDVKNIYEKNLLRASDFLDEKLNKISLEGMDKLFNCLTSQLVFDIHRVQSTFDVCAMFESINYRGKRLTKFEVLKNRIMYLGELMGPADPGDKQRAQDLRETIESTWGTAFDWFGTGKDPLDEDEFLLQHTIMYFGSLDKEKNALDKRLFKVQFSNDRLAADHSDKLTLEELEIYVESIKKTAELWAFQNSCITKLSGNPQWATQEIVDWILRLNRLGMRHFRPLILGALNQMTFPSTRETAGSLALLLAEIERFIFIVYGICGYHANESSKTYFSDYGWGIYHNESGYSFTEIVNLIDEYIYSYDEDDDFMGVFDVSKFTNIVHARFHKDKGWRDWNEIKYFLSEWEAHFKYDAVELLQDVSCEIMSADMYGNASVEHIMPQNTDAPGQWQENQVELGKRFKYVVHDLGNLTLLGVGANKAVHDIDLKCKAAAYQMTCDGRDILKRSGKTYKWGNTAIIARGKALLKFACERWRLPGQDPDSDFFLEFDDVLSTNVKPPQASRKPT